MPHYLTLSILLNFQHRTLFSCSSKKISLNAHTKFILGFANSIQQVKGQQCWYEHGWSACRQPPAWPGGETLVWALLPRARPVPLVSYSAHQAGYPIPSRARGLPRMGVEPESAQTTWLSKRHPHGSNVTQLPWQLENSLRQHLNWGAMTDSGRGRVLGQSSVWNCQNSNPYS